MQKVTRIAHSLLSLLVLVAASGFGAAGCAFPRIGATSERLAEEYFGPFGPWRLPADFAVVLRDLGEPSLTLIGRDPRREAWRRMLVPSFGGISVLRFELDSDGAHWTSKQEVATGWFGARKVAGADGRLDFPSAERLRDALDRLDFWDLGPVQPRGWTNLAFDGHLLILEGVRAGRYHAVVRDNPHNRALCEPEDWLTWSASWVGPDVALAFIDGNRRLVEAAAVMQTSAGVEPWYRDHCDGRRGR